MTTAQQQKAAALFAQEWQGKGYEKGDTQRFWLELLQKVLGVEDPYSFISFEDQVLVESTNFMDGYIESTKVLIEQKSIEKELGKGIKQSDGSMLNPFQQAKKYIVGLPLSRHPRWVVTCNFKEFWVYDMEQPNGEPQKILLENLEKEYYRLQFLVDAGNEHLKREMEVSVKAGLLVGQIHDKLLEQYIEKDTPQTLHSLNVLCVRLVFCLYAEDAGLFGSKTAFHDYLAHYEARDIRRALLDLFDVLDSQENARDPYMDDRLKVFPYVNGGLFSHDASLVIPHFTDELKELILSKASADFDWSEISPTIFGAVFESTLNPETRRSGGMHYTSIENIHKVIDPLFLNELKEEFATIKQSLPTPKQDFTKRKVYDLPTMAKQKLLAFQDKLASLTFLDPACGSGNFLTESFISLRRLENEVISVLYLGQSIIGDFDNPIKVNIHQFYGIEINDFAVSVATTALWIAEQQMLQETAKIASFNINALPLKAYHNIHEGNALCTDWSEIIAPECLNYIMGNPPFVGTKYQNKEQKEDILAICPDLKPLDYVTGWYKKAADMIQGTNIKCAFVSTNSITQGEQVAPLWHTLHNVHIDFAYRTFRWDSEADIKAHVHCVIIGFSAGESTNPKHLYLEGGQITICDNINGYLLPAPNVHIEARRDPICVNAPKMSKGSQPTDGGYLLLTKEEKDSLLEASPQFEPYIKRYMGADDLINNKERYCLWLVNCPPNILRSSSEVLRRLEGVRQSRLESTKEATRKWADMPSVFTENRQPDRDYIILPVVSSERRRYMPMCYVTKDVIANANAQMIPDGDLYSFGVLMSNVHNAWMRATCGRLETRYAYSATIVYNNFPWCQPTDEQKARIEQTAQAILDARAKYPDCSLADLYDEVTMPPELRRAHQENDRAVMAAYGFSTKMTESDCVAELFKMYQNLTK